MYKSYYSVRSHEIICLFEAWISKEFPALGLGYRQNARQEIFEVNWVLKWVEYTIVNIFS